MTSKSQLRTKAPIIGFVAYSGTGKTTLLTGLIPLLRSNGLRIAVIKHTHHDFDIDKPGKDSYALRQAGASQTLLASPRRMALVIEQEAPYKEVSLREYLAHLDQDNVDLILVEGFKHEAFPKIELQRAALKHAALYPEDSHIIAVASDAVSPAQCRLPLLDLNNPQQVCDFILHFIDYHH